ncbi:MAG: sulfatase-like hydrolase/transferase [Rhodothermaceae bacterium]|nr:sulfatase-like hydrolase/transferase [Rhodothermaceae bacterium]
MIVSRSTCVPLFLVLLSISCAQDAPQTSPDPLPNIVWITVEDMSPRLAAFGDSTASTPHIDRLAAEGVRYTNVYSISGVCAPSRSAIITGMYPTTIGAQHMRTMRRTSAIAEITDPELLAIPTYEAVPPPEVKCFTEYLRAEGYYCTNNQKTDYQFTPPITAWDESSNQAHWRNRTNTDAPFFAVFNTNITHESQVWSRADEPMRVDPSTVEVPPYYPDHPVVRRDIGRHYSNIELMDEFVGTILDELEEDGLLDNTIVFFFSDHGDGLPRMKRWTYDSGLHVPLIIRWPDGSGAGTVNDELVSFIDFAPTMLSLTGLPIPDYLQGQPFLGDQKASERTYVYAAKDRMDPARDNARAVRDKRFKYIRNYMPERPYVDYLPYRDRMELMQVLHSMHEAGTLEGPQRLWFSSTKPDEELYDTHEDPHEINNLADDPNYKDKLDELRAAHEAWKNETKDWGLIPETELKKRLWPPEGIQPVTADVQFTLPDSLFQGQVEVTLSSDTEGASIAYALDSMAVWQLYSRPLTITSTSTLYAQAIRIGYKHSSVSSIQLERVESE